MQWRTRFRVFSLFFVVLIFLLANGSLQAQLPTATLGGIVTDPQGAAVVGARVVATNKGTGIASEAATGTGGEYVIVNLPPGLYNVHVEAKSFAARDFADLRLEVGRNLTLDVQLALAALGQKVEVTGGAAQVELTQSAVQGQISATTIENIPLNGRNFLELAFLVPGNRPGTNFDPTKTRTLEVSSAGQFGRGGNITVDGGDNNDQVVGGTLMNFPQDAIQEFQIATNRYTAEVGHSGSSIINIATKTGTNDLHGSLFAFVRNKNLDARSAVEDRTKPQPRFDRQQFGGSVGGPIRKDRSWFFLSGEDRNQHAAVQVGERNFATQQVITTSAAAPLDDVLLLGRLDFRLTDRDNFFVRYSYNREVDVDNGSLRRPLGTAANRQRSLNRFNNFLGNWTRVFSPRVENTVVFYANTFVNDIPGFSPNTATTVPNLGLANELRFPSLQDGANFRIPQRTRLNTYAIKDDLAWTRGKHTLRFGGEVEKQTVDALFDLFGSKSIFLAQDFATQDLDGDGVIDDKDIPISFAITSTAPVRPPTYAPYSNTAIGAYFQDDWRVFPNLTLNIGVRYDIDTDVFANGAPFQPCPLPLSVQPPKRCVWIRTLLGFTPSRDPANFGPRLGFAWDPFKKGRTVIRGGYGIYYDRVVLEVDLLEGLLDGRILSIAALNGSTIVGGRFAPDPTTRQVVSLAPPGNPFGGPGSPIPLGVNIVDPNAEHPRVQQFTLGVQYQLGHDWVVSADGIHDFGDHFFVGRDVLDPTGKFITVTDPLTGASNIVVTNAPAAKTWYDGLLVSVKKRPTPVRFFGREFEKWTYSFNANYTLSKTLNYANDDQIPFNVNNPVDVTYQGIGITVNNLRLEKGYAPTDERHRFTLYGVLDAPWRISVSPILTIASSIPQDSLVPQGPLNIRLPILARNAIGRSVTNGSQLNAVIRQFNALPLCSVSRTFPCYPDALKANLTSASNPNGLLPLVNPNLTFGDKFASLDFRVTKKFTVFERHNIDLIAEGFNIFNITNIRGFNNNNFSGRVNDITSSSFYQAKSTAGGFFGAGGPRAFQFAVRYSF
jgi:hypothetical protein